jgi:hypothetical protein
VPLLVTGLIVRLMLRLLGFRRTLNIITASRTASRHAGTKIPLAFRIPYLTCLEDSLAKVRGIRKEGDGATLYIGVTGSDEYKFHAWIQRNKGKERGVTLEFVKMNPCDFTDE